MRVLALTLIAFLLNAVTSSSFVRPARDWRYWPFDERSPWNHPIGTNAEYVGVSKLASLGVVINYDDQWTVAVAIAKASDPLVDVLWRPEWPNNNWDFLYKGGRNCHNSNADELLLYENASPQVRWQANYYSTLSTPDSSKLLWPTDFHRASYGYRYQVRMPADVCPSSDTDGQLAIFQPDGWVLNTYATVVMSNGNIITDMASYSYAKGDGTGYWNGRRASMIPAYAGLIRKREIANGKISHAVALVMSPDVLKEQAIWPAYAFDRLSGYSGTLPMGALLAIPASVDINSLGLTTNGKILARAVQDYGAYVVDRGGVGGMAFQAEFGNSEIRWNGDIKDLQIIARHLKWVVNNTEANRGGGGILRVPLAPSFYDEAVPY
jgi:hypothetical protein